MGLIDSLKRWAGSSRGAKPPERLPNESPPGSSEKGRRATPEASIDYLYRRMWVDPNLRQAILDIREMDRLDGRVKRIHSRIARDVVKGGFVRLFGAEALARAGQGKSGAGEG